MKVEAALKIFLKNTRVLLTQGDEITYDGPLYRKNLFKFEIKILTNEGLESKSFNTIEDIPNDIMDLTVINVELLKINHKTNFPNTEMVLLVK